MMHGKVLILVLSFLCLVQFGSTKMVICWTCSTDTSGPSKPCGPGDSGAFTRKCLVWVGQYTISILVFNGEYMIGKR